MGDFYETFHDDAKELARILHITLTTRGKDDVPLAGIPYQSLDRYLKALVDSGKKIAICEQLEDPRQAKGVVKRGIVRIITPGTLIEDNLLQSHKSQYVVCVTQDALSALDISTGEFLAYDADRENTLALLAQLLPSEIVVAQDYAEDEILQYVTQKQIPVVKMPKLFFMYEKAQKVLEEQYGSLALSSTIVCVAGPLLAYVKSTQKASLSYIESIKVKSSQKHVLIDASTIKNLELIKAVSDGSKDYSVLQVLDKTKTAMGARLMRAWLLQPLTSRQDILQRQMAILELYASTISIEELQERLCLISDLARFVSKVMYGQVTSRDLVGAKNSLMTTVGLDAYTAQFASPLLHTKAMNAKLIEVMNLIQTVFKETDLPLSIREGGFIKRGYDTALDELWQLKEQTTQVLAQLEQKEIERTGIPTLKIKYNRVVGYYFEVSARYTSLVPADYMRKASAVGAERFVSQELKDLEVRIAQAQERIMALEYDIFMQVLAKVQDVVRDLQLCAAQIAQIDVLTSLAYVAKRQQYVQPQISEGFDLIVKDARHPVIEQFEMNYIPNDCTFTKDARLMILTGPNMAGKSTFMRSVALIVLLAHMGSFVPATSATISIVDRICTRVGAFDNLARGQSTFMVEMSETAQILTQATSKSLLILDEIGAATSTYDGVAIAWAVARDILKRIQAKTIFSTHYHILTRIGLEQGAVNYKVAVSESNGTITFLRKVIAGGTDKSYGIHVAKLAGLPADVIETAQKIQLQLEDEDKHKQAIVIEKRNGNEFVKLTQKRLL
jgi:DNA mismatch repair protein MutS